MLIGACNPTLCPIWGFRPKDEIQFVPYEFTPQYSGVATLFTSPEGRGQEDGLEQVKGLPEGTTMLGGVLVEPIGANSDAPDGALPASNGPPALMELNRKWNIPLAQAAGISSHFVSQTMVTSDKTAAAAGVPTMHVVSSDGSGCGNFDNMFFTISCACLSSIPPHTRCVPCSTWCPC